MDNISRSPESGVRAQVMRQAADVAGDPPKPVPRQVLCPFCGSITPSSDRCMSCAGRFDPLSRQATQNQMGPWSIRDETAPHRPGCAYETLARLVKAGHIGLDTVIRGPTTRQFWTLARHTPGVSQLLGVCHNCRAVATPDAFQCSSCHASFSADRDRQHLGIGNVRPLPGSASPELLAMQAGPVRTAPATGASDVTRINADAGYVTEADALQSARTRAARWKEASELDRKRGLIALSLASLVVLASLIYAGIVSDKNATQSLDVQASEARAARVDRNTRP